jgi:hypothetical protein
MSDEKKYRLSYCQHVELVTRLREIHKLVGAEACLISEVYPSPQARALAAKVRGAQTLLHEVQSALDNWTFDELELPELVMRRVLSVYAQSGVAISDPRTR